MSIPEEQRFTEAEFRTLTPGQRNHYANLAGQDRIDYVAARRAGRVLREDSQIGSSAMRGYGKTGTLLFACLLCVGFIATMMTNQTSQLALAALLVGAGGISICAFAWMLGAIETRIITLTAVTRAKTERS